MFSGVFQSAYWTSKENWEGGGLGNLREMGFSILPGPGCPRPTYGQDGVEVPWLSSRSGEEGASSTGSGALLKSTDLPLPCSLDALDEVDLPVM